MLGVALAVLAVAAVAAAAGLSLVNADALMGAIMSTRKLTFYYWQQDRLFNLVPAMAWFLRDITANFYFQMAVLGVAAAGLIATFVVVHLRALGDRRLAAVPACALVSGLATVVMYGRHATMMLFFEQHYALSYLLLLVGCVMLLHPRAVSATAGAGAIVGGLLVNPSAVLLAPVLALAMFTAGRRRPAVLTMVIAAGGMVTSLATAGWWGTRSSSSGSYFAFRWSGLTANVRTVLDHLGVAVHSGRALALLGVGGLIVAVLWRRLPVWHRVLSLGITVFAAAWVPLFAGVEWIEINQFHFRYFFPVLMLVQYATALIVVAVYVHVVALRTWARDRTQAIVGALAAGMVLVVALPAIPTPSEFDAVSSTAVLAETAETVDTALIVGSYWTVWPVVFQLEADGRAAYGVTTRGEVERDRVIRYTASRLVEQRTVQLVCTDVDADQCVADFGSFLGETWQIEATSTTGPLVLTVAPSP